jgi:hypothetical protein
MCSISAICPSGEVHELAGEDRAMKLVLLIPDGRGVRNFAFGPFLENALRRGTVDVLHVIPESSLAAYTSQLNGYVQWHPCIPYPDRPIPYMLRNCLAYAQMYWVDTLPMRRNRNRPVKGSWRTRAAIRLARLVGQAAASPRGIKLLDRIHISAVRHSPEVDHYVRLFREIEPAVLFCSNQRPATILPPVLAARSLGIPTASFIFSWDNLTTKGRIAAPFDHFLVWSQHMREELLRYYPDVSPQRVHIVGTPQFDIYHDSSLIWSREEFCTRVGADPRRPLICYSGGDTENAVADPFHVRVLLDLIRARRIQGEPQVILRPAPADGGQRYAALRREYSELIYAPPAWEITERGKWAALMPSASDVPMLANLTYHCALNVNFASTMTLDFGIRDKPVVNVAFDVTDPPHFKVPMWEYYQHFDHYRPVIKLGAARFARSADELAQHVNAYLANPTLDQEARRRFVELEVGIPIGQSSEKIIQVLEGIAAK